ncbi:MAG: energy transducer TonB, partial [bacterium]
MLALKKKVEHNIFPPPAFIRMGIISGETLLRFKIYPNGEMKDLEVLEYKGHETLMQTSVRAIEISAPFAPLPSNFPEAYLEVTAKFHYFIQKHK